MIISNDPCSISKPTLNYHHFTPYLANFKLACDF